MGRVMGSGLVRDTGEESPRVLQAGVQFNEKHRGVVEDVVG